MSPLLLLISLACLHPRCRLHEPAFYLLYSCLFRLENWRFEEWGDQVSVVSCDMRDWAAPEKADIIVSELLGSFGDNELSPECLDGAQHFLKGTLFYLSSCRVSELLFMLPFISNRFLFAPFLASSLSDDGVSIPCSYTSYLAPLSSSKLYNEVRGCRERDKDPECHFETPYVVRLHNFHQLAEPKACFTFTHPTTGRNRDAQNAKREASTPHTLTPAVVCCVVVFQT